MVAVRCQQVCRKPWFATASLLLGLVFAGGVSAGEFRVSPILQTVAPGESMATYRLQNTGDQSLAVQITGFSWDQERVERKLSETESLIVVPPLVTVAPGETQLVRVALEVPERDHELPFRLQFEEIPARAPSGQLMVRTALLVDVPLFFAVEGGEAEVDWTLSRGSDGSLVAKASNRGDAHARFTALVLKTPDDEELAEHRSPMYLLPDSSGHWRFENVGQSLPRELVLEVEAERTKTRHVLAVE